MMDRLKEWIALADERLAGSKYKVYMAPGNDDHFEVDAVINDSAAIVNANDRMVMVGDHEMVTFAWTNPTPWDTPREKPDEELEPMLEALVAQVKNKSQAIFNFHAPPYGYALDLAPELTADLIQAADRRIHVGSRAVAKMIDKYQPLLGLHGHIHESRGVQKIKKTTIINPGSEYSEGVLKGVVLILNKGKLQGLCLYVGLERQSMTADRKFRLPKDIPLDEYPKPEAFLTEGPPADRRGAETGDDPAGDGADRPPLLLSGLCRPVRAHGAVGRAGLYRHRLCCLWQAPRQAGAFFPGAGLRL